MYFAEFLKRIEMPEEYSCELAEIAAAFPFDQYASFLDGLTRRDEGLAAYIGLRAQFSGEDTDARLFACILECARRQYSAYQSLHIPEEIYFDTMKCYSRFTRESKDKFGEYCFDRGGWAFRQLCLKVFRIGELEYELCHEEDQDHHCKPIHVHIPSDARLIPEKIDASLIQARAFINQYFPEYGACPMLCESWLLSPAIGNMLPENSHIRAFQQRFEVYRVVPDETGCLVWLFQAEAGANYETLKENTSLQRKAKAHLLVGGSIGSGYGIVKGGCFDEQIGI